MTEQMSIRDLCKDYDDGSRRVHAVNGITLNIRKGETFGLVGESGCGKSTLGQMIGLLLKPTSGQVLFEGEDIWQASRRRQKQLHQQIQIIFQDPYSSLNPRKRIGWLVEEPLVIHHLVPDPVQRRHQVEEMLELVGLDASYAQRYPSELSGGQRQRAAIAIALILKPSFVVCDEAVSALDVSIQAQVLNLLKDLQQKLGLTYLFISHNLNVVTYMADRIGVMYLGSLVETGSAVQLGTRPLHPYTQALFSASVSVFEKAGKRIVLQGDVPSPAALPAGCPFHTRCPYARDICQREKPALAPAANGRFCACHRVREGWEEQT